MNLYAERIMKKEERKRQRKGYKIAGRTLNNLSEKADLSKLLRRLKRESEQADLYFNIKKTKIMTSANWSSFEIDGVEIEVVTSFTFLGSEMEKEEGARWSSRD